jgi:hypothetical protein
MKKTEKEMAKDYESFLSEPITHHPSSGINESIRGIIMNDLDPRWSSVMTKLLFTHMVISSLTLTLCPQFGLGPLGGGQGLVGFIESYGHVVCGLFCGGFFFIGSVLMAAMLFTPAQKRKINSFAYGTFSLLGLISLGTLVTLSSMIKGSSPHLHMEFIGAWLLAGIGISILLSKVMMRPIQQQA